MIAMSLFGVCLALILGLVCYFSTDNIIICSVVFLSFFLYFQIYASPKYKKYSIEKRKFHECYHFINNFIVFLSIKGTITSSLESTIGSMNDDFKEEIEGIKELNEDEKILYLKRYFSFHVYQLFTDIVLLYSDQGGDIIEMSNHIVDETRIIEEYISYSEVVNKKKLFEFGSLWFFSLAILFVLKFSLKDFYDKFVNQPVFLASVGLLFILVLISIHIFVCKATNLKIGGYVYEKE